MATQTYDTMWSEAMGELGEQLEIEGVGDDEGGDGGEAQKTVGVLMSCSDHITIEMFT
jgi:hypothetical protein